MKGRGEEKQKADVIGLVLELGYLYHQAWGDIDTSGIGDADYDGSFGQLALNAGVSF